MAGIWGSESGGGGGSSPTEISQGLHTIWVPADGMKAQTTNGATAHTFETATNDVMVTGWEFDAATNQYVQFKVKMPKSWDEGTVTANFTWTANSTGTGAVVWTLDAMASSDNESLDTAFGTSQAVVDSYGGTTAYKSMITATTAAITPSGSPSAEDYVTFRAWRNAASGSDTLAEKAVLLGVSLYYTVNAATDA